VPAAGRRTGFLLLPASIYRSDLLPNPAIGFDRFRAFRFCARPSRDAVGLTGGCEAGAEDDRIARAPSLDRPYLDASGSARGLR